MNAAAKMIIIELAYVVVAPGSDYSIFHNCFDWANRSGHPSSKDIVLASWVILIRFRCIFIYVCYFKKTTNIWLR